MRRALVAANWKMHGSLAQVQQYLQNLKVLETVESVLLPPSLFLTAALEHAPQGLACGVQDIGFAQSIGRE